MPNPHAESEQQDEAFGARLQRLRVAAQRNITQLAHAVGITEGAVRQMELGQTKLPSFLVGLRLADELDVDPWYLATGGQRPARAEHEPSIGTRLASLEQCVDLLEAERRAVLPVSRIPMGYGRPARPRGRPA